MGTRNLTLIQKDNEYKVAQYGQWDGYPGGVGSGVLAQISKIVDLGELPAFTKKVAALAELPYAEVQRIHKENGGFHDEYAYLSRDCAGDNIIPLIDSDQVKAVWLQKEFAGDGLFCEWCYVIDLDRNTFEVYKGFSATPLTPEDRFYGFPKEYPDYEPVKIVAAWSLDALPTADAFIAALEKDEEDEGELERAEGVLK